MRSLLLPASFLLLAGLLLLAVPLVLCMPLWPDVTLYDLAARNLLHGGVAYRDIFDTNFPGMVWLHVLIRSLFGWSSEVLRAVDLLVVGVCLTLMVAWPPRLPLPGRVLLSACGFAVYCITGESCHVQRDVWMLLPALIALRLRCAQVERLRWARAAGSAICGWAFLEGVLWGTAFWIKPFVAIPALACWVTGWLLMWRCGRGNAGREMIASPPPRPSPSRGEGERKVDGRQEVVASPPPQPSPSRGEGGKGRSTETSEQDHLPSRYSPSPLEGEGRGGGDVPQPITLRRSKRLDLLALFLGGATTVALGLLWLIVTSAWKPMLEVFTEWNPEYLIRTPDWGPRLLFPLVAFFPWGFIHLLAVPLALFRWNRDLRSGHSFSLFAAFYLAWLAQSFLIQKGLTYMLVPPLLLAVVIVGDGISRLRRPIPGWSVFLILIIWGLAREPFFRPERLALWPRCWREGSSPELRDQLALMPNDNNPDWTDLARVAEFLRGLDLHDGELTCYHNSPGSLYLDLDLRPSTRFLHFNTMLMAFPRHQEEVRAALAASSQRYVVSDLRGLGLTREQAAVTTADPLALPPTVPRPNRRCFPWNEPIVFRAGRYLVHRVTGPVQPLLPTASSPSP